MKEQTGEKMRRQDGFLRVFGVSLLFFSWETSEHFSSRVARFGKNAFVAVIVCCSERFVDCRGHCAFGTTGSFFLSVFVEFLLLKLFRISIFDSEDMGGKGLLASEFVPKGTLIWYRNYNFLIVFFIFFFIDRTADLNQESSDILTLDEVCLFDSCVSCYFFFDDVFLQVLSFDTAAHRQMWADYTWAISGLFFGPRRDLPVEEAIALEASHYLNHSCEANVGFASDTSLVTIRDIEAGEMISNDYALTEHLIGFFPGFKCNCGAANCRGQVSVNDWRIPELQVRYKGYFTSGVAALIAALTTDWSSQLQKTPFYQEMRIGVEVRPHPVPEVGRGLFATTAIRKGEMVCVDTGLGRTIQVSDVLAVRDPQVRDFYVRFGYQTGRKEFTIPTVDPLGEQEPDAGFYMVGKKRKKEKVGFLF
jgi:hypothetical protein